MNSLRVPVTLLIVIVVGVVVLFVFSRLSASSVTPSGVTVSNATTSGSGAVTLPTSAPAPRPPQDPASVPASIVGTWQSTDDPNYSVTVTSDGGWTDSYKGSGASDSTSQTGTYKLFTSQGPDKDFTGTLVSGVVYLKVTEGKDTLYYSVLAANGTQLQLSYLDRGNTLSFVRVQ